MDFCSLPPDKIQFADCLTLAREPKKEIHPTLPGFDLCECETISEWEFKPLNL